MKAAPAANSPTAQQVKEYAGYLAKWQEKLGLQNWRVEKSRRRTKAMADMDINYEARLATWAIGDFGSNEIDSRSLESTALHEMLHVLLYEFWYMTSQDAPIKQLNSVEHAVITVFERLLFPSPTQGSMNEHPDTRHRNFPKCS